MEDEYKQIDSQMVEIGVFTKIAQSFSSSIKRPGKTVTVEFLLQKKKPLLLGEEMVAAVQEYIELLRKTGAVVSTVVYSDGSTRYSHSKRCD